MAKNSKITREQADAALTLIAQLSADFNKISTKVALEKQRVDSKYSVDLAKLENAIEQNRAILEVWAMADKDNWEGKTYALTMGIVSVKTTPPKLEPLDGTTWEQVTALLKKHYPNFIQIKEEPKKQAIISSRDGADFGKMAKKCQFEVTQAERFDYKLKQ